jgi:hypothetical protein
MAPQLAPSQREQIHAMLLPQFPNNKVAETVGCSERAVRRIRSRLRRFGTTTSPSNRVGRRRKITPLMRDALFEELANWRTGTRLDTRSANGVLSAFCWSASHFLFLAHKLHTPPPFYFLLPLPLAQVTRPSGGSDVLQPNHHATHTA